jgi:GR25 family glycosyltransferase involved in LPS biosynthesis
MLLIDIPVFYINLDTDLERNKYMKSQKYSNGLKNSVRVQAVNGKLINNGPENMSYQEIGCTLSHIKAIEYFLKTDNEFAVISEDDSDFYNIINLEINLKSLGLDTNKDFCLQTAVLSRIDMDIDFNIHPRSFWDFGTSSYIINRTYAIKLLDFYGTHDNFKWNKFIPKEILDPRGGTVITRPVADELIYSLCDVFVYPIFSFIDFSSTINKAEEQKMQIKYSIKTFKENWR